MIRKNNFLFPFPPFHCSCVPLFLCSTISVDLYFPFPWFLSMISPFLRSSVPPFLRSSVPPFLHFAVPPFRCSSISLFLRSNFFPLCSTLCFLSLETFFHWHYFPYCSDKFFPALGFGAKIPPGMQVCKQHIFFVCLVVFFFIYHFFSLLNFNASVGGEYQRENWIVSKFIVYICIFFFII